MLYLVNTPIAPMLVSAHWRLMVIHLEGVGCWDLKLTEQNHGLFCLFIHGLFCPCADGLIVTQLFKKILTLLVRLWKIDVFKSST